MNFYKRMSQKWDNKPAEDIKPIEKKSTSKFLKWRFYNPIKIVICLFYGLLCQFFLWKGNISPPFWGSLTISIVCFYMIFRRHASILDRGVTILIWFFLVSFSARLDCSDPIMKKAYNRGYNFGERERVIFDASTKYGLKYDLKMYNCIDEKIELECDCEKAGYYDAYSYKIDRKY